MNTRIMIIDAHPVYAPKMAGFLGSLTFENVLIVPSGSKAMGSIVDYKPDVVILSATLPDTDSVELAGKIKSHHPAVAIIVQTGLQTGQQTMEEFKSAGVDYVLPRKEKDWSAIQEALTALVRQVPYARI